MECNHQFVVYEGEYVCESCGIITTRIINETSEWNNYEDSEERGRCGYVHREIFQDQTYGSMMSHRNINTPYLASLQRFSKWSLMASNSRSWNTIFETIQMLCSQIGLPKAIIEEACILYKQLEHSQKKRGETRRALIGAVIFMACKKYNVPRNHEEISKLTDTHIRILCKAISHFPEQYTSIIQSQLGIVERLSVELQLSNEIRSKIIETLTRISKLPENEFNFTPKTIVAGAIAYALGLRKKKDMRQVSAKVDVSTLSIYKVVSQLCN